VLKVVPLFGRGFPAESPVVTAQKRINLFVAPETDPDKANFRLTPTPGLTLFASLGPSPSRGALSVDGVSYSVNDSVLYRINPDGGSAALGSINTGSGLVSMAWNGSVLMIVDGVDGWTYTPATSTLAQIVDADFPATPTTVTIIAGRFVVSVGGTGRFNWSPLLEGASWDPLDFATAESDTDNLVAVANDHGLLVLMGDLTTEFWSPSGDTNVFARVGGTGVEWGCAAPATIAKFDTGLIFLAKNRLGECRVGKLNGGTFEPLDDQDVARAINAQESVAEATAFSYVQDGHTFYQLNVGAISLLYDAIGTWQYVSSGTQGERHRANVRAALSERPYVFDYEDGNVYLLDKENLTDNEETIVREVVTKHLFADYNRVVVMQMFVDMEVGATDSTSEPQIMLQVSQDGGKTWGHELWRGLGAVGQYRARPVWWRLGLARDFVFKLRVTDEVRTDIVAVGVQVKVE
jgi:hypothetical protein